MSSKDCECGHPWSTHVQWSTRPERWQCQHITDKRFDCQCDKAERQ